LQTVCRSIIVPDLSPTLPLYRRRLTRERFLVANSLKADLDKTIALMQGLLRERSLTPAEITDVVLVGGSSRIPYIAAELRKVFPTLAPGTDVNTDEAVAIGVAM
jgi:molecular chaperone DnaK (HSP70)